LTRRVKAVTENFIAFVIHYIYFEKSSD